ncbi:MAG TPA: hypothetical protein VLU46_07325 [Thermoanaerobaculia bacterium]|nr:hypothetical protein [Thermoanaerobaculia bacterium]
MGPRLIAALLLAATTAAAQTSTDMSTVVVPVVGSVTGVGNVHWHTDLELRNDLRTDVNVMLTMPAAPEANFIMLPLAAGASVRLDDVAVALGIDNGLSPLVVQTNGRKSVSVRATAYATRGTDIFPPQPIAINYGSSYFPVRVLNDLSFSDAFRTNVGLANLGDTPGDFTLGLQRVRGRNLAVVRISVPPKALWHMSIQAAFPLITAGEHFAVVVETMSPETYVYASVIENATNTARFVQPTMGQ